MMNVESIKPSLLPDVKSAKNKSPVNSPEKDANPSYTSMIAQAIMRAPYKRATLSEIYDFMAKTFDLGKSRGAGWRNCVRHTLSLNECFVKLHRPENGRSCNWTVHPSYFDAFLKGDYRKRRANRKKIQWLENGPQRYDNAMSYLREQELSFREEEMRRMETPSPHQPALWQNYSTQMESSLPKSHFSPVPNMSAYYNDVNNRSNTLPSTTCASTNRINSFQNSTPGYDTYPKSSTNSPAMYTSEKGSNPSAMMYQDLVLRDNRNHSNSSIDSSSFNRYSSNSLHHTCASSQRTYQANGSDVFQSYEIDSNYYSRLPAKPYRN